MKKEKKYSQISSSEKAAQLAAWLEDHKARNVVVLEIRNPVTDIAVIATATSVRHAKSLADSVNELCKQENFEFLRMEGYLEGQWVLVDMNDVIVHIFQESEREHYHLENLWREAEPIIVKGREQAAE